ncbi:hypothetical protein [Croceimicrobium hydrocarbonivorans]|uniref:Uncharacterized protein n=1 Tax=Croceimicrobium hydrocarbonivorans TaxID=2761580 RepID=A0A7H0VB46_9FLAO|nr:hypothetical protein [Croceimicrobium hydrocarbonivorans]QNR22944.1 hypothetical protein H4K34_11200 [Croceimicrobium hydrocarbonivorans]QNR22987.1 hypothetical protein H4K34_11415 [Croceimicrobium hydrocarbonivorans]
MTLAFSQQINGEPTHFVEKIWASLPKLEVYSDDWIQYSKFDALRTYPPKNHTIREDKSDRWHAGRDIHFVINNRTPERKQFAPVVKCRSVQKIVIKHLKILQRGGNKLEKATVWIDGGSSECFWINGEIKNCAFTIENLARNDGFETVEAFFNYFNKDFKGKIIHWTPLMY